MLLEIRESNLNSTRKRERKKRKQRLIQPYSQSVFTGKKFLGSKKSLPSPHSLRKATRFRIIPFKIVKQNADTVRRS